MNLLKKSFRSGSCSLLLSLTIVGLICPPAQADIAFTSKGKSSGDLVKVIHERDSSGAETLGFQYFSAGTYIKNLGSKTRYAVKDIEAYNRSLPQKINYDRTRHMIFRAGGTLVGIGLGVLAANAMAKPNGDSIGSAIGAGVAYMIAIGPATIIGGIGGYFAGGAIDRYFFVSAERNELRATLTSPAMWQNDRVVFDSENPVEAVAELDAALIEIGK
jgi:hypothetical protein